MNAPLPIPGIAPVDASLWCGVRAATQLPPVRNVPGAAPSKTPMPKLLAIVPAYNESACIAGTVADIHRHAPDFDVLVVDDGSTDETAAVARSAGARVVRHPFNLGIGGAVQSGYQFAREHGYDVAVQVDGDGQHDARNIRQLLAHLQRHPDLNMVTGSRFLAPDGDGYRSSASRRLGIRIFGRILSLIVGRPVTDPTSGFRMTDRRGIELFAHDYPHDYPEVEAVLMVHAHRLRSEELPVVMRERRTGRSSINSTRSIYYMIKVLMAVFVGLLRARPAVEPGESAPVTAEHTI
jgi:glycosyltransferase involved in cell wall biosynthesis